MTCTLTPNSLGKAGWASTGWTALRFKKIATRAFRAVQDYHFNAKGKPRYKGKGSFDSVEGKTNTSGIRWQAETQTVAWLGLTLPAIIVPTDKVIAHGLTSRVKFCADRAAETQSPGALLCATRLRRPALSESKKQARSGG